MQKLLILVFLFSLTIPTFGQHTQHTQQFDSAYFQNVREFLVDVLPSIDKRSLLLINPAGTPVNGMCKQFLTTDSALLTQQKLNDLHALDSSRPLFHWNENLVPNAHVVPADSIFSLFSRRRNAGSRGWENFHKIYGEWNGYTDLSAPIFLRDNTRCLFYYGQHCGGLCGGGKLTLYEKKNGHWEMIKVFCNWIS